MSGPFPFFGGVTSLGGTGGGAARGRVRRTPALAAAYFVCSGFVAHAAWSAAQTSMQRVSLADPAIGFNEAMSLHIPAGWQFHGEIVRNVPCSPGDPFPQMQASSPDGAYSLTVMTPFFTTSMPTDFDLRTCGTVAPLTSSADVLTRYVLPAIRRGAEHASPEAVPEAAEFLRSTNRSDNGISVTGDAARVRVSYAQNGQKVEEYVVALTTQLRHQGMPGGTSSTLVQIYRAPAGKLDEFLRQATTTMSVTPNAEWQQASARLARQAAQQAQRRGEQQRRDIVQSGADAGAAGRAGLAQARAQIQATGQASMDNAARNEAARHAGAVATMDNVGDRPTVVYYFCNGSGEVRTNNNPNSPGPGWVLCR